MTGHEKLIDAIKAKPDTFLRNEMLKHVEAFEYHDFKSDKAFPKIQLVYDLNLLGYEDLADLAMNGKFDDGIED